MSQQEARNTTVGVCGFGEGTLELGPVRGTLRELRRSTRSGLVLHGLIYIKISLLLLKIGCCISLKSFFTWFNP
jgi:hypothetical protein